MNRFSLLFLPIIILLVFSQFNCNSPTSPNSGLTLTVADVSCTEAWLSLSAGSLPLPANIVVNRNGNVFLSFTLTNKDTTLYDSSLLPSQTYTYQAVYGSNKSETVTAKTMDTTSSNFTWQKYNLGGAASSVLSDVSIINDTLAYAVGQIYGYDSTGQVDQNMYNAAVWDGKVWRLKRITVEYSSNHITPPLYSVLTFSPVDIWLSAGVPIHGDGQNWIEYPLFNNGILSQNDGSLLRIRGSNSSDIYFVGNKGTIVYYTNSTWQKLESGTSLDIQDIIGYSNSDQAEIYCIASDLFTANGNMVLQINDSQVKTISNKGLPVYSLSSIWLNNSNKAYLAGNGIYINNNFSNGGPWKELQPKASNDYLNSIRGNDMNDIVAVGSFGEVVHFNGVRWVSYINETGLSNGEYLSVAIKGNEIIAVGYNGAKAVILMGRRNI